MVKTFPERLRMATNKYFCLQVFISLIATIIVAPQLVDASGPPTTFRGLVNVFVGIINLLIPLIFTIIFVFMIWKLVDAWVLNVGDEKKRTDGKFYVMAAVLALFLAVSTWGIITLLRQSLLGA